jgi:hypothetical protein|tara:strand:- start:932 stop:1165 length:234 start_codon:yes stop_codon:yes gene_type:complete
MSINNLKPHSTQEINWLELSITMTHLSRSLREKCKENIEKYLIDMIQQNIHIASEFDIDLECAWRNWSKKALNKVYF